MIAETLETTAWTGLFAVVAGLGFVVGRFHALAQRDVALDEAIVDRDLANHDAAAAEAETERHAIDLAHAWRARDAADARTTTLRLQLDAAQKRRHELRAEVLFWRGAFQAAHLVLSAVNTARARLGAEPLSIDFSEPSP